MKKIAHRALRIRRETLVHLASQPRVLDGDRLKHVAGGISQDNQSCHTTTKQQDTSGS